MNSTGKLIRAFLGLKPCTIAECFCNLDLIVHRSIFNNIEAKILEILGRYALHGFFENSFTIICGDCDGSFWLEH